MISSWVTLMVLLCILILGFTLRIGSAERTVVMNPLRADAGQYFMYAYNLRYKHIYSLQVGNIKDLNSLVLPDSVRSPGYPLFLTPFLDDGRARSRCVPQVPAASGFPHERLHQRIGKPLRVGRERLRHHDTGKLPVTGSAVLPA